MHSAFCIFLRYITGQDFIVYRLKDAVFYGIKFHDPFKIKNRNFGQMLFKNNAMQRKAMQDHNFLFSIRL